MNAIHGLRQNASLKAVAEAVRNQSKRQGKRAFELQQGLTVGAGMDQRAHADEVYRDAYQLQILAGHLDRLAK